MLFCGESLPVCSESCLLLTSCQPNLCGLESSSFSFAIIQFNRLSLFYTVRYTVALLSFLFPVILWSEELKLHHSMLERTLTLLLI